MELRGGLGRLKKLQKVIEHLATLHLEMVPGVTFALEPFLAEETAETFPPVQSAPKPIYVFDPTGAHTDTWHDRGLNKYGPYTARVLLLPAHVYVLSVRRLARDR